MPTSPRGSDRPQDEGAGEAERSSGLEEAVAAPVGPLSDPGPGERSGLSSRIAHELLEDGFGLESDAAAPTRAVEIDDPARSVGDDPDRPIHGSTAAEFELG